jgi:hypothetical protein
MKGKENGDCSRASPVLVSIRPSEFPCRNRFKSLVATYVNNVPFRGTGRGCCWFRDISKGFPAASCVLRGRFHSRRDIFCACFLKGSLGDVNLFGGVTIHCHRAIQRDDLDIVGVCREIFVQVGDTHFRRGRRLSLKLKTLRRDAGGAPQFLFA